MRLAKLAWGQIAGFIRFDRTFAPFGLRIPYTNVSNSPADSLVVSFIDVEQGDAILVQSGGQSYLLVAAGRSEVVIQVGKDNRYGHPASQTLLRCQKTGAKIFRNDEHGDVIVTIKDDKGDVAITKED